MKRGAQWIPIGLALGVAVGLSMGNLAIGVGVGVVAGVVLSRLGRGRAGDPGGAKPGHE